MIRIIPILICVAVNVASAKVPWRYELPPSFDEAAKAEETFGVPDFSASMLVIQPKPIVYMLSWQHEGTRPETRFAVQSKLNADAPWQYIQDHCTGEKSLKVTNRSGLELFRVSAF